MARLRSCTLGLVLRAGYWGPGRHVRRFIHPTGTIWSKRWGWVVFRRKTEVLVAEVGGWMLGR